MARPELNQRGERLVARPELNQRGERLVARPELNQRKPAGEPRPVARASGRARSQRFRVTSARRSKPVIRRVAPGASVRGRSQTLGVRLARAEECEGIRGRPIAAGRLTQKLPSPALKEAERFGILQSGRFEHPYGGNCTAGTVQGHQARRATRAALSESTRPERIRAGEKAYSTLTLGTGGV